MAHVSDALSPSAQRIYVGVAKVSRTTRSRASCCCNAEYRIVATPVHVYIVELYEIQTVPFDICYNYVDAIEIFYQ